MYKYKAFVERVVDGDTIDVVIDLGFKITTNQRIRLRGINTPETYNVKKDSEEYKKGIIAKEFVINRLESVDFDILLQTDKDIGKYGRYIGIIWLHDSNISLNDELVQKGFALAVDY